MSEALAAKDVTVRLGHMTVVQEARSRSADARSVRYRIASARGISPICRRATHFIGQCRLRRS
jgi:hypothetical protein